jgi:hypothetical protein
MTLFVVMTFIYFFLNYARSKVVQQCQSIEKFMLLYIIPFKPKIKKIENSRAQYTK